MCLRHQPLPGWRAASLSRLSGGSPPALALGVGPPPLPLAPRSLHSVAALPRFRSRPAGCARCARLGERYFGARPCRFLPWSVATLPPAAKSRRVAPLSVFHARSARACVSPRLPAPLAPSQAAAAPLASLALPLLLARSLRFALPSFLGQAPRVPLAARALRSPMRVVYKLVLNMLNLQIPKYVVFCKKKS